MRCNRLTATVAALLSAAFLAPATARADDLLEIYRDALASDPQVSAAESQMFAAGENIVQARSALLPNISGTASLSEGNSSSTRVTSIPQPDGSVRFGPASSASDIRSRRYGVNLNQSVYNHANYTQLRAARASSTGFAARYDVALDTLFIRVAEAYFNALTATTNLEAALAEEKAVKRQLDQADQRFEVGLSAITDVHEARARADGARAAAILAQNLLDDAYEALIELTGKPVGTLEPLAEEIALVKPSPEQPESWVETAKEQSPALMVRKAELDVARANVDTAKAGHLPRLDFNYNISDSGAWGSSSTSSFDFPADSDSRDRGPALTLTVPIFEGFSTQSRIRQEVHNRDIATDTYEQEERAVVRRTRTLFRAVVSGISEVEARRQALVSANAALEATQAGFEVGTRTIVDVLISQGTLFNAQREYARARHDYLVNTLRLKQTAGTITVADLQLVNALLK